VEYNSSIFNESTIKRFIKSYEILLQGIVDYPNEPISKLPVLSGEERHKLLVEWNDTVRNYPEQGMCLHRLVEDQVQRTPDATAVIFEGEKITYRELNRRANQLANYLTKIGAAPEMLIGICMERSLEMVIGLLGIIKSGGAYVPLDPGYPYERLSFMVEDSSTPILLTQARLLELLPKNDAKVICLDSDWESIEKESTEFCCKEVKSDNLAYMIYTSGSTGKPKGAMNTHKGIVNRIL
jgi:non-ribosomal peptide synthetase component F